MHCSWGDHDVVATPQCASSVASKRKEKKRVVKNFAAVSVEVCRVPTLRFSVLCVSQRKGEGSCVRWEVTPAAVARHDVHRDRGDTGYDVTCCPVRIVCHGCDD